jgi:hypothetical protein
MGTSRGAKSQYNFNIDAFFIILIPCLLFFVGGCSPAGGRIADTPARHGVSLKIAVLPFQQIFPEDLRKGAVESPLTGAIFDADESSGRPEGLLEEGFLKHLEKNRPDLAVLAGERVAAVFRNVSSSSLKKSLRQALLETAQELGADLVVVGYLYRFRERQGESFSAEKPASVAFEIVMLKADGGTVVWRGLFDRTQRSLMEDIFQISSFLQGKGRWMKAEELAAQGLAEVMVTFPLLP